MIWRRSRLCIRERENVSPVLRLIPQSTMLISSASIVKCATGPNMWSVVKLHNG